jgi:integrase
METMPLIIKKIQDVNINKKINIRAKKGKLQKRWSLFLDYYSHSKHHFLFPKKYIIGSASTKIEDNNTLKWMQAYRDETERRLNNGEDVFNEKVPVESITFLAFIEMSGQGKARLPMYLGLKKHIIQFSNKNISFNDITPQFCRKFKDYLLGRMSASTAKTYLSALKATIHLAMKDNIIKSDPCSDIVIKAPDAQREFLLQDDIVKFINQKTNYIEVKNAFLFSCFTGLRLSDIRKLTWKETEGGFLYFRQRKTKGIDSMALTTDALSILDEQKINHENDLLVFNLPISKDKINNKLKSIITSAGINKKITFHCSRHTAAVSWINAGIDIFTVQKLLGHTDIKTTMIYAKLIDKKRDEYITKMPILIK